MHVKRALLYLAAAAAAILIGLGIGYWTSGQSSAPPKTAALLLNPPKALPAFTLENDSSMPITKTDLEGHWSLLYFGYTHCPDVCPTTMADLNKMLLQLRNLPAKERPKIYFISVDPKRDTPAVLKVYVRYFNSGFVGLTGTVDQLRILTKPLGVAFSYDPADQSGNYSVDHSSVVFLINSKGEETAIYTDPLIPSRMAGDYQAIIAYYGDR